MYDGSVIDAMIVPDSTINKNVSTCEGQFIIDGTELIDKHENNENITNGSREITCETEITAKHASVENTAYEIQS